jgi:FMN phosphatase YigB (HAD superfamily)
MVIKKITLSALLCILSISLLRSDAFIFDLGGVLIDTNYYASFLTLGPLNIAQYMLHERKGPKKINTHIKNTLFSILDKTAHLSQLSCTHNTTTSQACDETGVPLPFLMQAWLNGSISCHDIRLLTLTSIEEHPEWFSCAAEKRLVRNSIQMIFDPKIFIKTRKLYHDGLSFIRSCKKHGHSVFILSNWDSESFPLLQNAYPELFNLCDGIVISGNVNATKPSCEIYAHLLDQYSLDPQYCWFIDDQKENIVTAQEELGINSILCPRKRGTKRPDFIELYRIYKRQMLSQINNPTRKT